jgi:hypothetical protein
MKQWLWRIILLTPVLAVCWATGLFTTPSAQGDGCSRAEGYAPTRGGCSLKKGSVCYYCEYSGSGGGYSICGENVDGSLSLCLDFQDLPPLPNF